MRFAFPESLVPLLLIACLPVLSSFGAQETMTFVKAAEPFLAMAGWDVPATPWLYCIECSMEVRG
jgi:hypothetical protein